MHLRCVGYDFLPNTFLPSIQKGFKVSPVDYYQRPTVIASSRDKLMRGKNPDCVGDMPEVTQIYDYWLQMARTFGKNKTTPFLAYR